MTRSYNYHLHNDDHAVFISKENGQYCFRPYVYYLKVYTPDKDVKIFVTHSLKAAQAVRKEAERLYGEKLFIFRDGERIA